MTVWASASASLDGSTSATDLPRNSGCSHLKRQAAAWSLRCSPSNRALASISYSSSESCQEMDPGAFIRAFRQWIDQPAATSGEEYLRQTDAGTKDATLRAQ